jgi:hypothetical protein
MKYLIQLMYKHCFDVIFLISIAYIRFVIKKLTFLFCLFALSQGFAQLPSSIFLPTHSLSKGAVISTSQGPGSVFLNHAGLTEINSLSVSLSSEQRFGLSELNSINFSAAKRIDERSVIAFGIGSYGLDDLKQQLLMISYARSLSPNFDLSVAFDLGRIDAKEFGNTNQFSVEIGAQYNISKSINLGLIVKNPVSSTINNSLNTGALIALGAEFNLDKKVSLYTDVLRTDWDQWDLRSGLSYDLHERLQFNLGFSTGRNTVNFGFRINLKDSFMLDVAVSRHRTLGLTPSVGLVYEK